MRFLSGAGGQVDSSTAYLEPSSAAAYLALCQRDLGLVQRRTDLPLAEAAQHIRARTEASVLHVLALGSGEAVLETRLARHLAADHLAQVELCLLDLSLPMLAHGYRQAAQMLGDLAAVRLCAAQCDVADLPLYLELYRLPTDRPAGRLLCLLGDTFANLPHETRFLQQSLLPCEPDDWLLLDVPLARASPRDAKELRRRDKLFAGGVPAPYATWLGGPLWRHGKDVARVEFTWELEMQGALAGSYALHAVARVTSAQRAERRFSLFRMGRYDLASLTACLRTLGWGDIAALPYGDDYALLLFRKAEHSSVAG